MKGVRGEGGDGEKICTEERKEGGMLKKQGMVDEREGRGRQGWRWMEEE